MQIFLKNTRNMKLHEDEKEKLILWRNLKLLLIRIFSVNLFTFIIKLQG